MPVTFQEAIDFANQNAGRRFSHVVSVLEKSPTVNARAVAVDVAYIGSAYFKAMRAAGFYLSSAGGGMLDWIADIDDEREDGRGTRIIFNRITAPDSPEYPARLTSRCVLHYEESDSRGIILWYSREFASVKKLLEWLDSAEHVLPTNDPRGWTLREDNG